MCCVYSSMNLLDQNRKWLCGRGAIISLILTLCPQSIPEIIWKSSPLNKIAFVQTWSQPSFLYCVDKGKGWSGWKNCPESWGSLNSRHFARGKASSVARSGVNRPFKSFHIGKTESVRLKGESYFRALQTCSEVHVVLVKCFFQVTYPAKNLLFELLTRSQSCSLAKTWARSNVLLLLTLVVEDRYSLDSFFAS